MMQLVDIRENQSKENNIPTIKFDLSKTRFFKDFHYWNSIHYKRKGKKNWDRISAVIIFVSILPLFLLISLLIKLDSKGPIFYKQKRVGKNGKIFEVYKFRTMVEDSEHISPTTEKNDPRITRVGNFIRPISLDEFPQLINIIKGDMSFIGPRPISKHEFDTVTKSKLLPNNIICELIPKVRPGILGWAIFHGREKISYLDRCRVNKEYESNCSLLFDSYISFLTMKKYWLSYLIVISFFILVSSSMLGLF